ncbi:MAG: hypothetical protein ACE5G3_02380 [Gammaproteobacteria bacterium]
MSKSAADIAVHYLTALFTFALAALCFDRFAATSVAAWLLLAWVTFGTAFDFTSHILGLHFGRHRRFLTLYARVNFSALCFGIPFTALAGSFVIAEIAPDGFNAGLADRWRAILAFSLAFGALFLFARYRHFTASGVVGLTLDKGHAYTKIIFIARRIYLALALLIAISVMIEGFGTDWMWWSLLFGVSFIATVPLHIMRHETASMLSEAFTLVVLVWGYWKAFAPAAA